MNMALGGAVPALNGGSGLHGGDPESQGELPDGVTPADDQYPGIANLDPDLLHALREASAAANAEGVEVFVNSGWRSREYQAQLYSDAITKYGSEEEASRWVATPETSSHVSGSAVDIGDVDATAWFSQYGAAYGLCQTYENESWHYELRPEAATEGCPAMSTDAAMH
ncbi:M15 family metallopeptidase [Leucobacter viscericola]|uniref:M15 family metallopeptidase n=2 Tax=Leucobacter viscericola TaxID=2714935 RepID=A0A6G7XKL5_9MICO|nr:M15 family metallopeptidase [Leucobacter viscericola]